MALVDAPTRAPYAQFGLNVRPRRPVSTAHLLHLLKAQNLSDKEYRKGVHWLETLRLRRTKILEAAYTVSLYFLSSSLKHILMVT